MVALPRPEMPEPPRRPDAAPVASAWPFALASLGIALLGAFALLLPSLASMVGVWIGSKTYNHGFLIAPVSLFLIWEVRHQLARFMPRPWPWGLAVIAALALAWLVGRLVEADLVQHVALVMIVQAIVVTVLGAAIARAIWFPLFFLLFAVPVGEFLVAPLQDVTTWFAVNGIRLAGVPIYNDGVFLTIPNGRFEVAEACAGLRFLVAMVALGVLFGFTFLRGWWRRAVFLALALAIPILANGMRAFGIVYIGYASDMTIAVGVDHLVYGWIFFSIVMVLILALGWTMRDRRPPPELVPPSAPATPAGGGRFLAIAAACLVVVAAAPAFAALTAPPVERPAGLSLPAWTMGEGWSATDEPSPWTPTFAGADATSVTVYRGPRGPAFVFVAYYAWQTRDADALAHRNRVFDGKSWRRAGSIPARATVDGAAMKVNGTRLLGGGGGLVVWTWYWVDGTFTASPAMVKALDLVARLRGGAGPVAAIAVAAPYEELPGEAEDTLRAFLAAAPPLGPWLEGIRP
jgi:exosortase A